MTREPRIGAIHHIAIVVRSIEASLPRYRELFGLRPEAEPTVFASQRVRLCFLPTGPDPAARIELVEPVDEESGVARFLADRGEGVHHVCFIGPFGAGVQQHVEQRKLELAQREHAALKVLRRRAASRT